MQKFQAIIQFTMDDDFMSLVPPHRTYINHLINKNVIDSYGVSMETQTCWITINATDKVAVQKILSKSPLFKYWQVQVEHLFVYDSQHYRLPSLVMN